MADSEEVSVRIGSNKWKVGDDIRIVGSKVVNKEKLQSVFGVQWKTAHIEGKFLGAGSPRKYRVSWTSFEPPFVEEYGAQHSILKECATIERSGASQCCFY